MANRDTIKSLIPRIEGLADSLKGPAPKDDVKEVDRRKALIGYFPISWGRISVLTRGFRKLGKVLEGLKALEDRGKTMKFLNNIKDAEVLTGLADDIRDAMLDYQVGTSIRYAQASSKAFFH
jgi:hypothetical protein